MSATTDDGRAIDGGAALPVVILNQGMPPAATGTNATHVGGPATDGAPAVGGPVQIGALDGAGNVRAWRGNHEVTIFASAPRGSSQNSLDQTNHNARGIKLVVDITAIDALANITVTIKGKSSLTGKYYAILASASLNAQGTTILTVYPGLTAAANSVANDILPRVWRVDVTAGGTGSTTYSIDANYVV